MAARGSKANGLLSSRELFDLLRRRSRANSDDLDREIEKRAVKDAAVLACDSSGFTRKTHEYGILQFLAVMTRCYDALIPIIERHRGQCLSHGADNLLAVFAKPADALRAAAAMHRWLKRHNRGKDDAEQFNVCIGISWGKLMRLKDNVFGDRVNLAAKIGEDLASKDEILVTKEVVEKVKSVFRCDYARSTDLGGRRVELFKVRY